MVVDGRGQPVCVVLTTHVEVKPFREVTAQFAEGEGDRSRPHWVSAHTAYFNREIARRDLLAGCDRGVRALRAGMADSET